MIDSHVHLTAPQFNDDREKIIDRAFDSGISTLINIGAGYGIEDIHRALELCKTHTSIYTTLGIHPHQAIHATRENLIYLKENLPHPSVVGIGETGLDYYYDFADKPTQLNAFNSQLELITDSNLPIILHIREAHEDTKAILKNSNIFPKSNAGIIHCFSGTYEDAVTYIDLGFVISIPGIITFKKSTDLREIVKKLPIDKLIIETDAPYLAPAPYRGKRNEPVYVKYTLRCLAETLNMDVDELDSLTEQTTKTVYGLL